MDDSGEPHSDEHEKLKARLRELLQEMSSVYAQHLRKRRGEYFMSLIMGQGREESN